MRLFKGLGHMERVDWMSGVPQMALDNALWYMIDAAAVAKRRVRTYDRMTRFGRG